MRHYIPIVAWNRRAKGKTLADLALRSDGLPHIELCEVPGGPFLMGSDKKKDPQAYDSELPQHEVTLPEYWIGRYAVTNAQYQAFIKGGGHKTRTYWTPTGWGWRGNRTQPAYWDDEQYNGPRQPVGRVSWYEAVAYCRWLSDKTGVEVRLPSEAEWEKAARGTDGCIYPWGDELDESKCNVRKSSIGTATMVGKYSPAGDSPYGCADMAGNVWEWTSSLRKDYPYRADDGREDPNAEGFRVLRGGSFHFRKRPRCANRFNRPPSNRFRDFGFRVVVLAAPFSRPARSKA